MGSWAGGRRMLKYPFAPTAVVGLAVTDIGGAGSADQAISCGVALRPKRQRASTTAAGAAVEKEGARARSAQNSERSTKFYGGKLRRVWVTSTHLPYTSLLSVKGDVCLMSRLQDATG